MWMRFVKNHIPKNQFVYNEMGFFLFRQNESCHSDTENDLNDVPMDCENDSSNHVENTPKSLDGTVCSPKNSPIPFRNMPRGRRRNTNKTGKANQSTHLSLSLSLWLDGRI